MNVSSQTCSKIAASVFQSALACEHVLANMVYIEGAKRPTLHTQVKELFWVYELYTEFSHKLHCECTLFAYFSIWSV